jgi:hypothetical protein
MGRSLNVNFTCMYCCHWSVLEVTQETTYPSTVTSPGGHMGSDVWHLGKEQIDLCCALWKLKHLKILNNTLTDVIMIELSLQVIAFDVNWNFFFCLSHFMIYIYIYIYIYTHTRYWTITSAALYTGDINTNFLSRKFAPL